MHLHSSRWVVSNAARMLCIQKKGNSLQQFCMIAGVSTGASVRSRKLQQRDAILRRTGFIEAPACIKGVGGTCPSVDAPLAMCLSYSTFDMLICLSAQLWVIMMYMSVLTVWFCTTTQ